MTAPTNASTGKTTYTFTVPTAITLEGDTSYWVMAETGGGDQRQLVLPVATTIFAGHMW